MTKLPEPLSEVSEELDEKEGFSYKTAHLSWDSAPTGTKLFTEDQMIQFRRDALEEAIERIEALREDWGDVAEESGMCTAISEIRKMKDKT
jgi:hypothetical protein